MGNNASTSISNVGKKIIDELEKTTGKKDCLINVGAIILKGETMCTVTNIERCSDNPIAVINAISRAAAKAWLEADDVQKELLLPGVGQNEYLDKIQEAIKNRLRIKCPENSNETQNIAYSDLVFEGCKDASIMNINAGSNVANCAIRTIIREIIRADMEASKLKQDVFINLFGAFGLMSGAISSLSCVMILCCAILIFLMKNLIFS